MEVTFLGAAREVTGSMHVLSVNNDRIMLDCGMFQGLPSDVERNRAALPYDPATEDGKAVHRAKGGSHETYTWK